MKSTATKGTTEAWLRFAMVVLLACVIAASGTSCSSNSAAPCTHEWRGTRATPAHAAPLARLDFGAVGYCSGDPVKVTFAQGSMRVLETIDGARLHQ